MGMYYDASFAYGAKVAEPNQVDYEMYENAETPDTEEYQICKRYGVHFMLAGHYDRDMLFLVKFSHTVSLGTYKCLTKGSFVSTDDMSRDVQQAAEELGLPIQDGPGYLLVPDLS